MRRSGHPDAYGEFEASELFCSACRQSVPVRKRLLLALPEGDKYDYVCSRCGNPVGSKLDKSAAPVRLIAAR
ncbi:MAG: cytoplasmic protein [Nitrospirae bacterium]|nr:cytoplasmic protein [Nitrospirota bacterium]